MKHKILFIIFSPILLIWCFPTIIAGLSFYIFSKINKNVYGIRKSKSGVFYILLKNFSGVSLYPFIFVGNEDEVDIQHERGHCIQALIMSGWLYLLLVGIPSGLSNTKYAKFFHLDYNNTCDYYNTIWEKSADFFGGVKHTNIRYNRVYKED